MPTYPISLPLRPAPKGLVIKKKSAISGSSSPSSFVSQTYVWPGQMWALEANWPPGKRATMEPLIAALSSLNGMEGSVLLGDTANLNPRGSAAVDPYTVIGPSTLNGGFETAGAGAPDAFANWAETYDDSNASLGQYVSDFVSGSNSAIFSVFSGIYKAALLTQNVLTVGHNYQLTFWGKTDLVGLQTIGASGTGSNLTGFTNFAMTTSWAQYTVSFTATSTTFLIMIGALVNRLVLLDDVTLVDLTRPPVVNGAGQTGYSLNTKRWTANRTGVLLQGDWIQLGTGATSRLYKLTEDANSDGSGNSTLVLWPRIGGIRSSPADNAEVTIYSPKGKFMMVGGDEWSIDEAKIYGVSASFAEDLRP